MPPWLRTSTALREDQVQFLAPKYGSSQPPVAPVSGIPTPSSEF